MRSFGQGASFMFIIEHFVGSKRGKWLRGRKLYLTEAAARDDLTQITLAVVRCDYLNPIAGRVVPAL